MKIYDRNTPVNIGRFLSDLGGNPKAGIGMALTPHIWLDPYHGKPYRSPLSQKEVSSRAQRREEMRAFNVREVEPSESPFHRDSDRHYKNREFARKHQMTRFKEE